MLSIVKYPDPILSQKAAPVILPLSGEIQHLIRQMWQVVQGQGIGLAAPQVAASWQMCIIKLSEDPNIAKKFKLKDFVMINPEITFYSRQESKMVEGCLSFPEEYWEIWRPSNIVVKFTTISNMPEFLRGEKPILKNQELQASGWLSRVIQHEVDHLNGKLFINLGGEKLEPENLRGKTVVD